MMKSVRFIDHVHGNADKAKEAAAEHYTRNCFVSTTKLETIKASEVTPEVARNFTFVRKLVEYLQQELPASLPPYLLGLWLGDGLSTGSSITTVDDEIITYVRAFADTFGLRLRQYKISFFFAGDKDLGTQNVILKSLHALGLIQNKHIPRSYLENSVENRLELLAGLIDSDGHLTVKIGSCYEITQKNIRLAEDIAALATGLGFFCRTVDSMKCATNTVKKTMHAYKRMTIHVNRFTPVIPVRLERKKISIAQRECTRGIPMFLEENHENAKRLWTEDQKTHFWDVVEKYKLPSGVNFAWKRMAQNEVLLKGFSGGSMKWFYDKGRPKAEQDSIVVDEV